MKINQQIPLTLIQDDYTKQANVILYLARLDQINTPIWGNKRYKLKYNLQQARNSWKTTLLTFGGAYSNHIRATAIAGKKYGFKTIGIIRGEELANKKLNTTLQFAKQQWMELYFLSRSLYKNCTQANNWNDTQALLKKLEDKWFFSTTRIKKSDIYIIPEWWTNSLALQGTAEILPQIIENKNIFTHWYPGTKTLITCPIGTAGTISGILSSNTTTPTKQYQILWFPAIKISTENIHRMIQDNLQANKKKVRYPYTIINDYNFWWFAKTTPELAVFTEWFSKKHAVILDHTYTGKMIYGIYDLLKQWQHNNTIIIAIHTHNKTSNH